jgi:hypothetical protein
LYAEYDDGRGYQCGIDGSWCLGEVSDSRDPMRTLREVALAKKDREIGSANVVEKVSVSAVWYAVIYLSRMLVIELPSPGKYSPLCL